MNYPTKSGKLGTLVVTIYTDRSFVVMDNQFHALADKHRCLHGCLVQFESCWAKRWRMLQGERYVIKS